MVQIQKIRNHWEFKKREQISNSCGNECESSSSAEPVFKKHKSISDLKSPKARDRHDIVGCQFEGRCNKMKGRISDRDGLKDMSCSLRPANVSIIRNLMESILEELRVGGEKMLASMRNEVQKMMEDTAPVPRIEGVLKQERIETQHQHSVGSVCKFQNCDHGRMVGLKKHKRDASCQTDEEILGKQGDHHNTTGTMNSVPFQTKSCITDSSTQFNSLTLPNTLREADIESHKFGPLLCRSFEKRMGGSGKLIDIGKANPASNSGARNGLFLGVPHIEKFKDVGRMASNDIIDDIGHNKLPAPANLRTEFITPSHYGPYGGLKSQSQLPIFSDLSMNGRLGLDKGHGPTEFYIANDLYNIANSRGDNAWAQGNFLTSKSQRGSYMHKLDVSRPYDWRGP